MEVAVQQVVATDGFIELRSMLPPLNAYSLDRQDRVNEIVIVNGPPGVGKTTVCRILAEEVLGTVCIHGDDLRAFAPKDARAHLGGGSTYRAAAVLSSTYLQMGAARVVFDYVFLRQSHVAYFHDALARSDTPVHMFTLWAPLEMVENREQQRIGRSALGPAVRECWEEIERNRDLLGNLVDATSTSATDLAMRISALLEERVQLLKSRPTGGCT